MKSDEIDFVAEVARAGAGLAVDRDKLYLIESRLAPVARREGFGAIREMLLAARQKRESKLMWAVVEALASGETSFFRDNGVFERFRTEMLPALAKAGDHRTIRVWSAGCGSGQEAYSLALVMDEAGVFASGRDAYVLGSDLSERALEKARTGLFTQFEVQRGLPIRALVEHFEKQDELWAVSPRIQSHVRWRRVNLNADIRGVGRFEVVFCRNVVWAMEAAAKSRLLEQLADAVEPGGYLVLGQEETAEELGADFARMDAGVYQRDARVAARSQAVMI